MKSINIHSIAIVITQLSLVFSQYTPNKNLIDYETKGNQALFEIANFTNHIPVSYKVFPYNSDDIINQLKSLESVASFLAAGGFAAIYPELIQERLQFYSMNNIDKMYYMIRQYREEILTLISKNDTIVPWDVCIQQFNDSSNLIVQQFHSLYVFMRAKKQIDWNQDMYALAQNITQPCDDGKCDQALYTIAYGLIGNKSDAFPCDLMDILYQGNQASGVYRGYRDMVTATNAYLISLMSAAVTVQSAYRILKTSDMDQWIHTQQQNSQIIRQSIQRVKQMDQMLQSNYLQNAQSSLNYVIKSLDVAADRKATGDAALQYLQFYFPEQIWLVKVFNQTNSQLASTNYFNCPNCFQIQDSMRSQYVFVAAFPKKGSTPNKDYLEQFDWKTLSTGWNAKDVSVNFYNGYCLQGVQSSTTNSDDYTTHSDWDGFVENKNEKVSFVIWSIKESCQKTQSHAEQNEQSYQNLKY